MVEVIDSRAEKESSLEFVSWKKNIRKGRDFCLVVGCLGALASPFVPDNTERYTHVPIAPTAAISNADSPSRAGYALGDPISNHLYRELCYGWALAGFLMAGSYAIEERLRDSPLQEQLNR